MDAGEGTGAVPVLIPEPTAGAPVEESAGPMRLSTKRAVPTLSGFAVKSSKSAGGIGSRFEMPAALAAPAVAAPKPAPAAPAVAPKPKVRFTGLPELLVEEKAPAVAAAPAPEEEAESDSESDEEEEAAGDGDAAESKEAEVEGEVDALISDEEVRAIKKRLKGNFAKGIIPPPADAPLVTREDYLRDALAIRGKVMTTNPVEAAPADELYRPISSPRFSDFIVQVYEQFSPMLREALRAKAAGTEVVKTIDQDACKRRDPNKVETFYYQKFVRDYLSRGAPYRGLLVYHGLGTGKTCTSIAAAEALYWGGQKTIFVMTPATLSNNYRRELGKCGYFPLRQRNYWLFMPVVPGKPTKESIWLEQILGLAPEIIAAQGGGWMPNPDKPSNWDTLSDESRASIRAQQNAHLNSRFKFIHYNGVTPTILSQLSAVGVKEGKSMFDDAVIIIDEIHNLVRTINGTQIGSRPISNIIEKVEPREPTWSAPIWRERPGFRYPRGYTLYRLLQNAVGAKVIALSATPMINYAQELAILMNIVGGEQRIAEISLKGMSRDMRTTKRLVSWAQRHPAIDYYAIEESAGGATILTVSPVPYGYSKVLKKEAAAAADEDAKMDDEDVERASVTRGFVRLPPGKVGPVEASHERNMEQWTIDLISELEQASLLKVGGAAAAAAALAVARASGPGTEIDTAAFVLRTLPIMPEDPKVFVSNFVDRNTLEIRNRNVLKARSIGLVSFYKGGSEEMMPRLVNPEETPVRVPMSDYMFQQYAAARMRELEMESPAAGPVADGEAKGKKGKKGKKAAIMDMYAKATSTPQTGFLALSRAACNWVFPEEVPRPVISAKEQAKLLGLEADRLIAADLAEDTDAAAPRRKSKSGSEVSASAAAAAAAGAGGPAADDDEEADEVLPDKVVEAAAAAPSAATKRAFDGLMAGLEAKGDQYLSASLEMYSPKYATMIKNIRASPGPVLVYSQFKTLEGLGIFAAALRASPDRYVQLDIYKPAGGEWELVPAIAAAAAAGTAQQRYILYTGDQDLDKRRLLLQLYNADIANLPPRLSAQCAELLRGDPDNRNGNVARVFMITQSGAEGISLFNTRQVHIMEPYWNNVRLQQVRGRAIRLCSHMNLPWNDRTVELFTYLSVFTDKQKAEGARALIMADKGMSTDEMIFDIATKKQTLSDGLFEIIQTAAVDCELHFHEHGKVTQCFKFPEDYRPLFAHHPDWRKDMVGGLQDK